MSSAWQEQYLLNNVFSDFLLLALNVDQQQQQQKTTPTILLRSHCTFKAYICNAPVELQKCGLSGEWVLQWSYQKMLQNWISVTWLDWFKDKLSRNHSILLRDLLPFPDGTQHKDKEKLRFFICAQFAQTWRPELWGAWSDSKVSLLPSLLS